MRRRKRGDDVGGILARGDQFVYGAPDSIRMGRSQRRRPLPPLPCRDNGQCSRHLIVRDELSGWLRGELAGEEATDEDSGPEIVLDAADDCRELRERRRVPCFRPVHGGHPAITGVFALSDVRKPLAKFGPDVSDQLVLGGDLAHHERRQLAGELDRSRGDEVGKRLAMDGSSADE